MATSESCRDSSETHPHLTSPVEGEGKERKDVTFTIAEEEDEEDTASITIDVSCYEGSD